ncbi:resuscitation-promoting factor [Virgibacillus siamensis]|uniref:Resuscitation-promoting factor n=1 Tax=Virgibacillus siamensis TaxID=480071 RepID=A0ABN1G5U6_9BACI
MKKLATALAAGVFIAGATVTTASAAAYEVEQGDTLWAIAQEHGTSAEQLQEINDLKNTVIYPNQTLNINKQNNSMYQVKSGDTLYGIGQANNVSVQEIIAWNKLSSSLIIPGQELSLSGENVSEDTAEEQEQSTEASASESTASEADTSSNNEEAEATKTADTTKQSTDSPEGRTITVSASAYTGDCAGCSGVTATGVDLNANPNAKVIAVDPSVIPLGSKVYVEGYGYATAADVGSAIQGNKIDVHVSSKSEAYEWGVRTVDVTIVE